MSEWLDLEKLVTNMLLTDPLGPGDLVILGGQFPANQIKAFLQLWRLPRRAMPWSLWQWTDDIDMQCDEGMPGDLDYLERGRVFGSEGDLDLRRDGARFLWRFVGQAEAKLPQEITSGDYGAKSFWEGRENWRLRPYKRSALLWGSRDAAKAHGKSGWHDDRVGWAGLDYPQVDGNRVQVAYIEYLDGSNVELVRLLGLENAPQQAEGGDNA